MTIVKAVNESESLRQLARHRPRDTFLRATAAVACLLTAFAWSNGDFRFADFGSERHLSNFGRFAGEILPAPMHMPHWNVLMVFQWLEELMTTAGFTAAAHTLAISVSAAALAGVMAILLALPAARTFTTPSPYLPHSHAPSRLASALWALVVSVTRAVLILLRAIPEYVWAFVLIAAIGPTPWAAVCALGLHNAGILGKLLAETIEDLEPESLASLRALGAQRRTIALVGIVPAMAPRALLLFFYRWESCVREATVLGMLGVVSLGYLVQDARARQHYDVMFVFVLVSSAIVIIGDVLSLAARESVRRSD